MLGKSPLGKLPLGQDADVTAQELVLIAATQVNNSSALSISSNSLLNAVTATQNNNTSLMLINAIQQLNSISATQINTAGIMNILSSGDDNDLSGLELVQISEVYDLLKIKNEYSLIKK